MLSYAFKRLAQSIPTLFIVITISFFLMRLAPGGPFDGERKLPPEIEANILAAYNLDKPLYWQFFDYLGGILQGDFGPSFKYKDFTVSDLIWAGFPVSLELGMWAMLLGVVFGVSIGCYAALKQNTRLDYLMMGGAMAGIAIPNFVMAPILTLVFGVYLSWLPVGGWDSGAVANKVLPVIALALPQIAYIARMTRGSMIEVMGSHFIRTARAKGLSERKVVRRHALKSALLPVVSYLGPATAGIITGSVVIEQIFGIPGIGRYFVQAALNRDYTLVMGTVVFYGALIILFNLVVDLIYGLLDPQIRYDD
ncbi:oligopeptide ABC transporter permease OppB [Marinobacter lutaoensis]|jgi:oligopeptide transport system permease protein|uniref:Oligopeptide transporter permease n=1 Tax=Marinobacter lutaoensis TaxID=135739 RepID=A0A1V2DTQ3_9GAMM|nr:oligopeptide ABC transporter permease OppB [Marinobacter lutaoensis]MBE02889.1 oligopeptide ABC transporter permease OppB [Marinobacter sp.]MBI42226.1 oligopeptide ABC transporter permease OppB [Oceanospirillales bacterium]NVD36418.1 oligopeptide ABC transporter permease OppB [Marinobacter lutaoensis]ONF43701.1 oligopeptide transporter permease [Marinobacter lutaoensis]|tara:strand:- start:2514 stop:3440 length:927 start_codon:yes stop_codon:yes gene_type:complete